MATMSEKRIVEVHNRDPSIGKLVQVANVAAAVGLAAFCGSRRTEMWLGGIG